jgi:hypothetical protein
MIINNLTLVLKCEICDVYHHKHLSQNQELDLGTAEVDTVTAYLIFPDNEPGPQ